MLDNHLWRAMLLAVLALAGLASSFETLPSCSGVLALNRSRFLETTSNKPGEEVTFSNTLFEELTCLGYNPALNLLSATIQVKLPFGFNGDLCTNGSFEYVRFWVNYGSGWNNAGLASVNTHDILDSEDCLRNSTKPLYYTISTKFQPEQERCEAPILPRVRATLSWNAVPSGPFDDPLWGNTLEESIQPLATQLNLSPTVIYTGLNSNTSVDYMDYPYASHVIEQHPNECAKDQAVFSVATRNDDLDTLPADSQSVLFEEVTCLGLDWALSSLVATVRVKQRRGYFATPCQNNSFEYVSFWADWNDTCSWTYLGTTRFNVHDFDTAPSTGLVYTAVMPVDLRNFSAPCNVTKIARVRAALAFNKKPPPPPEVAPRGNFIETHVHLQPFSFINTTAPFIRLIGNVPLQQIETGTGSPISGMTLPSAMVVGSGFADPSGDHSRPCPFGGTIIIRGDPVVGHSYRLLVRPYPPPDPNYPGLPVTSGIEVVDLALPNPIVTLYPTADGYFDYLPLLNNFENTLSFWTPAQGAWQIRLEMAHLSNGVYQHEDYTPWYMVLVNQNNPIPQAYVDIFGTSCNNIGIGTLLTGTFYATSSYFDHWEFNLAPGGIPNSVVTVGNLDPLFPVPKPGQTWQLATVGSKACGYVISVESWDRTVVDSTASSRYVASDVIGFCLQLPQNIP